MFRFFPPAPQSPRQIEAFVAELVGEEPAAAFWRGFREHWIGEPDIAAIAAPGMNHVRLPINARLMIDDEGTLIEDGIALVDRLLDWCRAHDLWVILDLHGAPGGQTGTNIDDSPNGRPDLFVDDRCRALTVALWRLLAGRYRDDTTVAGYDLLNEPLPEPYWREHSEGLVSLYRDLTAAIREVDPNHLLVYEGTHWATNWDIFTEVWDENSALSFHKYWSPPDRGSIAPFLERREALGLPIYMGEGGENGLGWLQTAFQLYDDCDISWNFWPWKKIDTHSSPCSVTPPPGWSAILEHARGGARPSPHAAAEALEALVQGMKFENCVYRPEVVAALRRTAPVRLAPAAFGFRGEGSSYATTAATPHDVFRRDDRVTVRPADGPVTEVSFEYTDGPTRPEQHWEVELAANDWVAYEFGLAEDAVVGISVSGASRNGGSVEVAIGDVRLRGEPTSSGWSAVSPATLPAGRHGLRVAAVHAAVVLTGISIDPVRGS